VYIKQTSPAIQLSSYPLWWARDESFRHTSSPWCHLWQTAQLLWACQRCPPSWYQANMLKVAAGRKAEERHLVMLYKSLVLTVVDYALPMINISQNLMGLERLQNACLRIVTGYPRSTPVHVLQYLVGIPSIDTRQKLAQATITCKALQESRHGLSEVIFNELTALQSSQQNTSTLPHPRPGIGRLSLSTDWGGSIGPRLPYLLLLN